MSACVTEVTGGSGGARSHSRHVSTASTEHEGHPYASLNHIRERRLVSKDPFVAAAEGVMTAGRAACDAIESAICALEVGARARSKGVPIADIVDEMISVGGRDVRLSAVDAFHGFERAVAEMRAHVVHMLVDVDGLSLTEVARRLQVSRQAVARLYRDSDLGNEPTRVGT
jgi:Homeodomain-like domain